uniref:Uncharacterized protein n=1 Tax=Steinernema glaseri TaxID=37863 RepID=A0A1I7Z4C6_9BILA
MRVRRSLSEAVLIRTDNGVIWMGSGTRNRRAVGHSAARRPSLHVQISVELQGWPSPSSSRFPATRSCCMIVKKDDCRRIQYSGVFSALQSRAAGRRERKHALPLRACSDDTEWSVGGGWFRSHPPSAHVVQQQQQLMLLLTLLLLYSRQRRRRRRS